MTDALERLSVSVAEVCSRCSELGEETHIESCHEGRLAYNIYISCGHCGHTLHALGEPPPIAPIRRRMLDAWGTSELAVTAIAAPIAPAVRMISDELDIPVGEALRLAKSGATIFVGTPVEANCFAARLRRAGASVQVTWTKPPER